MKSKSSTAMKRALLGFSHFAVEKFNFLSSYGFVIKNSSDYAVSYENSEIKIEILHDRVSYEIDVTVTFLDSTRVSKWFSIIEIQRLSDNVDESELFLLQASERGTVASAVEHLAEKVKKFFLPELSQLRLLSLRLAKARKERNFRVVQMWQRSDLKTKEESYWNEKKYREYVMLLETCRLPLTPIVRKRLSIARRRASRISRMRGT